MPTFKLEFDLTPELTRILELVLTREKVGVDEACRILLTNHLESFRTAFAIGIQKNLPKRPVHPPVMDDPLPPQEWVR